MSKHKDSDLVDEAKETLRKMLNDAKVPPATRSKIAQDILDRYGAPKRSMQAIKSVTVSQLQDNIKEERKLLLTEYEEIKKEMKEIEGKQNG